MREIDPPLQDHQPADAGAVAVVQQRLCDDVRQLRPAPGCG